MGNDITKGEYFHCVVPANCWFASRPLRDSSFSFTGCTVAPGFDFEDFELPKDDVLIVLNKTPVVRNNWEIHIEGKYKWKEIFNSDSKEFWGTGDVMNVENIVGKKTDKKSKNYIIKVHLPALAAVVLG